MLYPIREFPNELKAEVPKDQLSLVPTPHQITKRKYSTSIDPRNFLTVYEYPVGEHWVIWDHECGLVHLTGLWKAVGNNKADIVRLVQSSPELETHLKRIRGGYLKIQGTWIPYDLAKTLATKFCYSIRYALVPLFGASFPEKCLQPFERGFGLLRLHVTEADLKRKSRRRRKERKLPLSPINHYPRTANASTKSYSLTSRGRANIATLAVAAHDSDPSQSSPAGLAAASALTVRSNQVYAISPPASKASADFTAYTSSYDNVPRQGHPLPHFAPVSPLSNSHPRSPIRSPLHYYTPLHPRRDGLLSVLRAAENLDQLPHQSLAPRYSPLSASRTTLPVTPAQPDNYTGLEPRSDIKQKMSIDGLIGR